MAQRLDFTVAAPLAKLRERTTAPIPAAFFEHQRAATTSSSLYGCTDPFMLIGTRKAKGLGQSSNRSNNDDKEAT
jgi:hypothetical protein